MAKSDKVKLVWGYLEQSVSNVLGQYKWVKINLGLTVGFTYGKLGLIKML